MGKPRNISGSGLAWLGLAATLAAQTAPPPDDKPVPVERVSVTATATDDGYDATGMGSLEEELREEPFANDLIGPEDYRMDADAADLAAQLAAIAETSPADRIAGEDRLNLRGFPTPMLRDSFNQIGIPEVLNTGQTIVIQGPLVPVLGRAAPGGIQNFIPSRPRTKASTRLGVSVSDRDRQRATLESTGPLQPKKTWQRVALEWGHRGGPEQFAREETRSASAALTIRHSRSASTLVSANWREVTAIASPGVPDYIPVGAVKAAGPCLPLAYFNANGPEAGVRRRSAGLGVQFDGQPTKGFALRAGVEGWWREVEQDRFTTSQLDLATGLFAGTREPRHLEQPQQALVAQVDATLRFRRWRAEHKLLVSASHTWGSYLRVDRALPAAVRDALPLAVRRFNPYAPDYYWPAYSADLYSRVLADRREHGRYASLEVSDRAAWRQGRLVVTGGLRVDQVALEILDRRPGATIPRAEDTTSQVSSHLGVNYQVRRNRLLVFASTSSAFDPSTPVDARTGRIQRNETTLGYEAGLKGRAASNLDFSASALLLYNQHISRRNPLYNDPVADASQTQPQLVAAGEERFSGARMELRWLPHPAVTVTAKGSHLRAITTASPDLPQEVGLPLTRLPEWNATASVRFRGVGKAGGPLAGLSWQYLDGYVGNYEDSRRDYITFPGYGLVSASAGWAWIRRGRQLEAEVGVRNLLNRNLVASNALLDALREVTLSARLSY